MLERLKRVYGAVQERSLLSVLSHFYIYDGRVQATDGRMGIDAPLPELAGVTAVVPADRFLSAIGSSDEEPRVVIEEGRIVIVSGRFRARIPIMPAEKTFPHLLPNPPDWELEEPLLPILKQLRPFIADDATNIWSTGLLLTTTHAYATNNVCLVGVACSMLDGTGVSSLAIPRFAVDEILRFGMEPTQFGVSENCVTFHFDDVWLRTQLIVADWPQDRIAELFKTAPKKMQPIPDGLKSAVEKVLPFCKEPKFPVVILSKDGVATEQHDHEATVTGMSLPEMRFNANMLSLALKNAEQFIGGAEHRCYFKSDNMVGIVMALRQ